LAMHRIYRRPPLLHKTRISPMKHKAVGAGARFSYYNQQLIRALRLQLWRTGRGGTNTPTIRRLTSLRRHQLLLIALLQERIAYLLTRPVVRPPNEMRRYHANFTYQAGSWTKPRRVTAKVEWHPGELYPRVGFIVTNMSRPAERVLLSTTSAEHASNGSRKARARSNGRGCHAVPLPLTPCVFSSMRWRTTWATSCGRWRCRKPRRRGR